MNFRVRPFSPLPFAHSREVKALAQAGPVVNGELSSRPGTLVS